jgi:hypothetical protein
MVVMVDDPIHLWPPMGFKPITPIRFWRNKKAATMRGLRSGLGDSRHRTRAGAAIIRRRMMKRLWFIALVCVRRRPFVNDPGP